MTNYNERLDEILEKFRDSEQYSNGFDGYENIFYTKQAITSLIKELVADAKPRKYHKEDFNGSEPDRRKKVGRDEQNA